MSHFDKLRILRHKAYSWMGNGRDALFDLDDAALTSRSVYYSNSTISAKTQPLRTVAITFTTGGQPAADRLK